MVVKHWILEVGNTRVKWAAFDADAPLSSPPRTLERVALEDFSALNRWKAQVGANDLVWVSGSGKLDPWSDISPSCHVFKPGDALPLRTNVTSPETLGLDRVANVWAVVQGASEDPSQPWLIVDAGTCVTMDLLDRGTHIGGTISPGLQMRLTAMAHGTANLPQPDLHAIVPELRQARAMGSNTPTALLAGAVGGLVAEIEGRWAALRQEVPNLGLILTGGDAVHLELRGIRPKFADAHLTLKGHHALLRHFHDVS